jgi:hypothetical protein
MLQCILILWLMLTPISAWAANDECGDQPPYADESLRAKIEADAQFLSRRLGGISGTTEYETKKNEILSKYPNADRLLYESVLSYRVCQIVMNDSTLTTKQKVDELSELSDVKSGPIIVTTSRGFSGPEQYPPESFAAYGIVAFPSRASSHDMDRHLMICEAYVTALPHSTELVGVPYKKQMITVWPIDSDETSTSLNEISGESSCDTAVKHYGLAISHKVLKEAEIAGANTSGSGPYLLAWSPTNEKGKKDALVLVSDLSDVTTYQQAQAVFRQWINDIQQDSELWEKGWNMEKLRIKIRLWADMYGPKMLAVFSGK